MGCIHLARPYTPRACRSLFTCGLFLLMLLCGVVKANPSPASAVNLLDMGWDDFRIDLQLTVLFNNKTELIFN